MLCCDVIPERQGELSMASSQTSRASKLARGRRVSQPCLRQRNKMRKKQLCQPSPAQPSTPSTPSTPSPSSFLRNIEDQAHVASRRLHRPAIHVSSCVSNHRSSSRPDAQAQVPQRVPRLGLRLGVTKLNLASVAAAMVPQPKSRVCGR